MTTAINEAQSWKTSSANKHGFKVEKEDNQLNISALEDNVVFSVKIPDNYPNEPLNAFSEDEDLEGYLNDLNGAKPTSVQQFLNLATKKLLDHFEVEEEDPDDESEEDEEEEDDDVYMEMPDLAQIRKQKEKETKKDNTQEDLEFEEYAAQFQSATGAATDRLMKELRNIYSVNKDRSFGFTAEPDGDNLYLWYVKIYFDPKEDGAIAQDMQKYKKQHGQDHVLLEMKFKKDYPFSPPFIRVVKPRFQFHTGHVTIGGSICMELLTSSGWAPTNDVEGILVQIRAEMIAGGARIDFSNLSPYTEHEAQSAFRRVAARYGWE
eukprot:gb/GECH01013719.1/.p1 GENE.gb/GECH01013719.1/~~gb/GECH01013719.1/.p1  ORF type:complete len:321 (+),score=111.25 gb/GECH01013719.1/:1-963(+)